MSCPICGTERTGSEFTPGGIVLRCLAEGCNHTWRAPVTQDTIEDDDEGETESVEAPRPVVATKRVTIAGKQSVTPRSVVKMAKAELRTLDAEIKRLEKLKIQRDELRRLIVASKQPSPTRTATVRHLRATGE